MIEKGRNSAKYFSSVYESSGNYTYRFKTKEEFEQEQGVTIPDLCFEESLT